MKAKSKKRTPRRASARSADDALQVAYTKLFKSDIELLKQQSKEDGVPWQVKLRGLVHLALTGPRLAAFKFLVPPGMPRPVGNGITAEASLAIATGHCREEALAEIEKFCAAAGKDARWLNVADLSELPLDKARVLGIFAN